MKRLKLSGKHAEKTRERIVIFLFQEYGIRLHNTVLMSTEAYLCHLCKALIHRYFDNIVELNRNRDLLRDKLSGVTRSLAQATQPASLAQSSRKRSTEDESSGAPITPKRPKDGRSSVKVTFLDYTAY